MDLECRGQDMKKTDAIEDGQRDVYGNVESREPHMPAQEASSNPIVDSIAREVGH